MKFLVLLLIACFQVSGATLLKRELFSGASDYSGSTTGAFTGVWGIIQNRAVGPYTGSAPGFSWATYNSGTNTKGSFSLTNDFGMASARFRFEHFGNASANGHAAILMRVLGNTSNTLAGVGLRSDGNVGGFGTTGSVAIALSRWYEIALTWFSEGIDGKMVYRVYVRDLTNGSFTLSYDSGAFFPGSTGTRNTKWLELCNGINSGSTYYYRGRVGGLSVYQLSSSNDVATVTDLTDAANFPNRTWYVNSITGNDTNSGIASGAAWQTGVKLNAELQGAGIFSATNNAQGDTVYIDTSGGALDMTTTNYLFTPNGLTVKAAPGNRYWSNRLDVVLTNADFSATGPANVFQITTVNNAGFGQSNIVVWENDKWMNHPTGATWASVSNNVCTNAGSFWTDGATIYVHPFGNTIPTSDSKVYTRSVARSTAGDVSAVNLAGGNMFFADCYAGKTCMATATANDPLSTYAFQSVGSPALNGFCIVSNCYGFYASKHTFGWTLDTTNSTLLTVDCIANQGSPYGSHNPFVSYSTLAGSTNNIHRYIRCTVPQGVGLIGSTSGTNYGSGGFVGAWLAHNAGTGMQWTELSISDCDFSNLDITAQGASHAMRITNSIFYDATFSETNLVIERSTIRNGNITMESGGSTLIRNSIFTPTSVMRSTANDCHITPVGTFEVYNCTFDFRSVTFPNDNTVGWITLRTNTIWFSNNVVMMPFASSLTLFQEITNATLRAGNNIFTLAQTNPIAKTNGAIIDFTHWQANGFDASSISADARLDSQYRPLGDSPSRDFGVSQGSAFDFTGNVVANRNDAGALEYRRPRSFKGWK